MAETDNNKNNLGFLGEEYQFKLVKEFVEDKEFFKDLSGIVDQNMFTNPSLRSFVGTMKEYYQKYESVPSYDIIQIRQKDKSHTDVERMYIEDTIQKIKDTKTEGSEYIRDLATKFFKQQVIIKTAHEILQIAGNGDVEHYDECRELLEKALSSGDRTELGTAPLENLKEVLSDEYRISVPTGVGKIDETLEGGLGKGELGVIIGSSSFGKTSLTTAIANYAATFPCEANNGSGYKCLQIVFEDRIKQIQRKHIARITGVEAKDLSKPNYIDYVLQTLEQYPYADMLSNNLRIVKLPSGEYSAWDIERLIKKEINNGFRPDLVIVDYFECLAPPPHAGNLKEHEQEGKTMRKLEALAGELNIALWVPTQGTKDSFNLEIITMDKAGGSVKKIQIGHIVISIARSMEDIDANKATIAVLKNRAGGAGKVFNNVDFNNGTCRISTDYVDEFENMLAYTRKQKEDEKQLQKEIFQTIKDSKKAKKQTDF